MLFDIERKKLELEEKKTERQWEEQRKKREQRFQLFNTLISALVGALFTAIIAWLWTGKSDTKPTIIVQPIPVEKDASKTTK